MNPNKKVPLFIKTKVYVLLLHTYFFYIFVLLNPSRGRRSVVKCGCGISGVSEVQYCLLSRDGVGWYQTAHAFTRVKLEGLATLLDACHQKISRHTYIYIQPNVK